MAHAATPYTSVVAFEMNPAFASVLRGLLRGMAGGELVAAAAWTTQGTMKANMQLPGSRTATKHGLVYNMTASALITSDGMPLNRHQGRRKHAGATPYEASLTVPTIDLANWLADRFCPADHVEIKMDIEGAEFEVLEHLLRSGRASLVDSISIEWHTSKRGQKNTRIQLQRRQQTIIAALQRAKVNVVEWKL